MNNKRSQRATRSTSRSSGKSRLLAVAAAAAGLVLASCSSAVQEAQSGSGEEGGTLVVGTLSDLNPASILSQSTTSMAIGRLVFDTLIRYDRETLEPQPSVATDWEISDDGLTVTLQLRDDVTFHSGREFTSEDVAYALERYGTDEAGSQLGPAARAIESVDTSDPHVAVLNLSHPLVNLFDLLEFALLTDSETEAELFEGEAFVGTGPFTFEEWNRGQGVTFSQNTDYWNGTPPLDGVELRIVPDETALLNSVRSGQVNVVVDASPRSLAPFRDDDSFTVEPMNVFDVSYYVGTNVQNPILSDPNLRKAISESIDRERILNEVFDGVGSVNSAPWSPNSPAYNEEFASFYSRDLDAAQAYIDEAGGAPTQTLELAYNTALAPASAVASIVQSNLADIGIQVELEPMEGSTFNPHINSGEQELWIAPHGFGQSSPATLATGAAPFRPVSNLSGFESDEYAELVESVWFQSDPLSDEAREAYDNYTQLLIDEQFLINIVSATATNVYTGSVEGVDWNIYKYLILDETTVN